MPKWTIYEMETLECPNCQSKAIVLINVEKLEPIDCGGINVNCFCTKCEALLDYEFLPTGEGTLELDCCCTLLDPEGEVACLN